MLTKKFLTGCSYRIVYCVEGSYSCHKKLREYYDLRLFLTVDPDEQMRRIKLRNGEEQEADYVISTSL